jgi:hypothetical protein
MTATTTQPTDDEPEPNPKLWGAISEWQNDRATRASVNSAVVVATYDGDLDDRARWDFASALHERVETWIAAVAD